MAMVVCRFCNVIVRVIPPLNNSYKVKGICRFHVNLLRRETRFETIATNYMSDVLESCIKGGELANRLSHGFYSDKPWKLGVRN